MSGWVAGAVVVGSLIQSNAASKAAKGAAGSAREANQLQWDMFQTQREDQKPWWLAGSQAVGQLSQMTGPGGEWSRDISLSELQTDPGYQFRLQEGLKALERSGAMRGQSLSGAQFKGLADFSQGLASQEYGNATNRRTMRFNQLASLAGLGQQSMMNVGQAGQNAGNIMGQNMIGASNMRGAAGLTQANIWGGALNNLANTWQSYANRPRTPASPSVWNPTDGDLDIRG